MKLVSLQSLNVVLESLSRTFDDGLESHRANSLFENFPALNRIRYSVVEPDNWPQIGDPCRVLVKGREPMQGTRRALLDEEGDILLWDDSI